MEMTAVYLRLQGMYQVPPKPVNGTNEADVLKRARVEFCPVNSYLIRLEQEGITVWEHDKGWLKEIPSTTP